MIVGYVNGNGRTPSWILYSAGWMATASVRTRSSPCPGSGVEAGRTSNLAPTAGSQAAMFCLSVMVEVVGQNTLGGNTLPLGSLWFCSYRFSCSHPVSCSATILLGRVSTTDSASVAERWSEGLWSIRRESQNIHQPMSKLPVTKSVGDILSSSAE